MILLANAGLPMLAIVWPVAWFASLPVVLIESVFVMRGLGLRFRRAAWITTVANAASTFVGIPLTWIVLVFLQMLTGGGAWLDFDTPIEAVLVVARQATWLCPYQYHFGWMIPLAAIFLCIPFYFTSVALEYAVTRRMVDSPPHAVRQVCCRANLWSYLLLVVFWECHFLAVGR